MSEYIEVYSVRNAYYARVHLARCCIVNILD